MPLKRILESLLRVKESLKMVGVGLGLSWLLPMPHLPPSSPLPQDLQLGVSMARIGVRARPNVDDEGKQLFICLGLEYERGMFKKDSKDFWLWQYSPDAKVGVKGDDEGFQRCFLMLLLFPLPIHPQEGKECCSNKWIGTHYVRASKMKVMEDLHLGKCEGAGYLVEW